MTKTHNDDGDSIQSRLTASAIYALLLSSRGSSVVVGLIDVEAVHALAGVVVEVGEQLKSINIEDEDESNHSRRRKRSRVEDFNAHPKDMYAALCEHLSHISLTQEFQQGCYPRDVVEVLLQDVLVRCLCVLKAVEKDGYRRILEKLQKALLGSVYDENPQRQENLIFIQRGFSQSLLLMMDRLPNGHKGRCVVRFVQ